jgi:hypothetical protein
LNRTSDCSSNSSAVLFSSLYTLMRIKGGRVWLRKCNSTAIMSGWLNRSDLMLMYSHRPKFLFT